MKNTIKILSIFFVLVALSSCNESYQKLLKSPDFELKYRKAKEYYNSGDYFKATPLFEELMTIYKGRKELEKLYYFYAYCHYGQRDYLMAAYYFKNFTDRYGRSIYAEDAQYMIAYCHYKMSPKPTLEQASTKKAIESFQLFTNMYPESDKLAKCNELIDRLRLKLEAKAFKGAELYYRLGKYKAAATAFDNLLIQFPETPRREEVQFLIVKSYYLLAKNSISSKQEERYGQTIDAYYNFIDKYPNSPFIKDAEKIFTDSNNKLQKT